MYSDGITSVARPYSAAVAAIGPITAATAAEYGLATDIMPAEYTIPALARAIVEWFARSPKRPVRRGKRSE